MRNGSIKLIIMLMARYKKLNQSGFIPLLILIVLVVAALVYVAYTRVLHANK